MQPKTTPLHHTPRMRRLGPGRWLVESRTRPGIGYPCSVDACGCTAGKYGRMCHHRKLVMRAEAWLAGYAPLAPAPVTTSTPVASVPVPAPVPAAPTATDDFHASPGYLGLAEAFGL